MIQQHQEWLEDLVIRLLCVFALDRFGDFVSDEVSILREALPNQISDSYNIYIYICICIYFFANVNFLAFSFLGCGTGS